MYNSLMGTPPMESMSMGSEAMVMVTTRGRWSLEEEVGCDCKRKADVLARGGKQMVNNACHLLYLCGVASTFTVRNFYFYFSKLLLLLFVTSAFTFRNFYFYFLFLESYGNFQQVSLI
jgi:hypothetical protein